MIIEEPDPMIIEEPDPMIIGAKSVQTEQRLSANIDRACP